MASRCPTEHDEQAALCDWLWIHRVRFFSVPNGVKLQGKGKWGLVNRLRREGLTAGAPDIVLIDLSPELGCPVAVEMKRAGGMGRVSAVQRATGDIMLACGWEYVVAHGASDAISKLCELGYGRGISALPLPRPNTPPHS